MVYTAPTLIDGQPTPAAMWQEALDTLQELSGASAGVIGSEIRRLADLSIPTGVETAVPWDDDGAGASDPLGVWTSASPTRLTIPTGYDGRWSFKVAGQWAFAGAGGRAGWFVKNAVTSGGYRLGADGRPASPATETTCAPHWEGNLVGGDFLELRVYHTAGVALSLQSANTHQQLRIWAKRLGPAL